MNIKKAKATAVIAEKIIKNGTLALQTVKFLDEIRAYLKTTS